MTIRPRAVRALRDIRERLRDSAAATHATATADHQATVHALASERARMTDFLDRAGDALTAARTVHDLDRIAEIRGLHQLSIADAADRESAAIAITEITAGKLRERTRQLRSAEKLVELVEEHRAKSDARAEQHSHDELAAARVR